MNANQLGPGAVHIFASYAGHFQPHLVVLPRRYSASLQGDDVTTLAVGTHRSTGTDDPNLKYGIRPTECLFSWADENGSPRMGILMPYMLRRIRIGDLSQTKFSSFLRGNHTQACFRSALASYLWNEHDYLEAVPPITVDNVNRRREAERMIVRGLCRGDVIRQGSRTLVTMSNAAFNQRNWLGCPLVVDAVPAGLIKNRRNELDVLISGTGPDLLLVPTTLQTLDPNRGNALRDARYEPLDAERLAKVDLILRKVFSIQ
jgi:hypothetical protein